METAIEKFVFSMQPPPTSNPFVDSTQSLDSIGTADRAESDILGCNDVGIENVRKEATCSFKSKLMNMASPNHWFGSGNMKEKLKIILEGILITEGPTGSMMTLLDNLKEQL